MLSTDQSVEKDELKVDSLEFGGSRRAFDGSDKGVVRQKEPFGSPLIDLVIGRRERCSRPCGRYQSGHHALKRLVHRE